MENKTYTQAELDAIVKEKSELSFRAGLEKGKGSVDNSSVDELNNLKKAFQEKEEALKEVQNKLRPYEEKEKQFKLFEDFKKANGREDVDLTDYNLSKYQKEDNTTDWDGFFKKNPSLRKEVVVKKDSTLEVSREDIEVEKKSQEQYQKETLIKNV